MLHVTCCTHSITYTLRLDLTNKVDAENRFGSVTVATPGCRYSAVASTVTTESRRYPTVVC